MPLRPCNLGLKDAVETQSWAMLSVSCMAGRDAKLGNAERFLLSYLKPEKLSSLHQRLASRRGDSASKTEINLVQSDLFFHLEALMLTLT